MQMKIHFGLQLDLPQGHHLDLIQAGLYSPCNNMFSKCCIQFEICSIGSYCNVVEVLVASGNAMVSHFIKWRVLL